MMCRSVWFFLVIALQLARVEGACANSCSGHGTCGAQNICSCFTGWNGGAADCSYRECPKGSAWADKAHAIDSAHLPAECSNAGTCDRKSGTCQCFDGFTGSACQRSSCPNSCSGHGTCMTIADLSYWKGPDYDPGVANSGDGKGIVYTNWDKDSILMCDCDGGFFGADCSLVMCPKGDDPLTINQNYRTITLTVSKTSGSWTGSLGFQFQGVSTYLSLTSPSASNCISTLQSSPHMGLIGCSVTNPSALTIQYSITFYSWPTNVKSNNLHYHDGNPPLRDFLCDTSLASTDVSCAWGDVWNTNVVEWEYCSNRGLCDFTSGECACADGFGGAACSNQTYSYSTTGSNALPGFQVNVAGGDFVGDALQIRSEKGPSSDFYLLEAIAGNQRVFAVRGDGVTEFTGFSTHNGGQTISSGGLYITTTGMTIAENGMSVSSSSSSTPVATIASTYSGTASISSYAALKVTSTSTSTHYLMQATNQGTTRFSVDSTGLASVTNGLQVTAGLSILSSGLAITGGLTVNSGSVNFLNVAVSSSGSAGISAERIIVNKHGLQVTNGGVKVYSGGINVFSGGLQVQAGFLTAKAGMSITAGGLTVFSGGIVVKANGIDIQGGGLTVTGTGLTVTGTGGISTSTLTATGVITASGGIAIGASSTFTAVEPSTTPGAASYYYLSTSDRRLKRDLQPLESGLDKVRRLKSVYFYWTPEAQRGLLGAPLVAAEARARDAKDGSATENAALRGASKTPQQSAATLESSSDRSSTSSYSYSSSYSAAANPALDGRRHIGFLAQDVQKVVPEAVSEMHGNRYLGVDYAALVPVLVGALQELDAQQKAATELAAKQAEEIALLRAELQDLRRRKLDGVEPVL